MIVMLLIVRNPATSGRWPPPRKATVTPAPQRVIFSGDINGLDAH
jgi:hypothetical protein